jgi:hypothetical protein
MRVSSLAVRHLASRPALPLREAVAATASAADRALVVVRAYYVLGLVLVMRESSSWPTLLDTDAGEPLWPARWMTWVGEQGAMRAVLIAFGLTSLLVALVPWSVAARGAYAVAVATYAAGTVSGFGRVNHSLHAWLFVAVILVFLPGDRWRRRRSADFAHRTLSVVWACQLALLLVYTLSGVWKVAYATVALVTSKTSGFEPDGFSLIVMATLVTESKDTVVGDFFARNELVGWVTFMGAYYLETASLLVLMRPRLHRVWGVALIVFHIGTGLAMDIAFVDQAIVAGLFLVLSPFAPDVASWRAAVRDLPGVFVVSRAFDRRRPASPLPRAARPRPSVVPTSP